MTAKTSDKLFYRTLTRQTAKGKQKSTFGQDELVTKRANTLYKKGTYSGITAIPADNLTSESFPLSPWPSQGGYLASKLKNSSGVG